MKINLFTKTTDMSTIKGQFWMLAMLDCTLKALQDVKQLSRRTEDWLFFLSTNNSSEKKSRVEKWSTWSGCPLAHFITNYNHENEPIRSHWYTCQHDCTSQKPLRYTILVLTCPVGRLSSWSLWYLPINSDCTHLLSSMSVTIADSYRHNSGLELSAIVPERYLFYVFFYIVHPGGTDVAHGTSLYGAVRKILALIFWAAARIFHYFDKPSPNLSSTSTAVPLSMDQPHCISPDEEDVDNDDPLMYLYFGTQALETLWQCKCNKSKLQMQKVYFPITYAWQKAAKQIKCWWCRRQLQVRFFTVS